MERRSSGWPGNTKGKDQVRRFDNKARMASGAAVLIALLFAGGCATPTPAPEPVAAEPKVPIVPPATEQPASPAPVEEPKPAIPSAPEPIPEPVTIIVSGPQAAYSDVAEALLERYDDAAVFDLGADGVAPVSVMHRVNDAGTSAIVAVGLHAARAAVAMGNAPVVFSQVFNYREYPLLTERTRAVAAHAPLERQLAEWLAVDPAIERVGVIVGEGHDDLIAEARAAADLHGIELLVHVSGSDQETLYVFRRMSRDIDGLWLFPDSRVLSARSLAEMSGIAERQRARIAVQNEGLLAIGAALSLSSVASDIADVIAGIVGRIQAGQLGSVPPISPLREVRVRTAVPTLAGGQ